MTVEDGSGRPFVGRAKAVEGLRRRFEEARGGTGGVTVLVGDAGAGKSTLISELVRDIRGQGVRVLVGRALALDDPPPYSLIQSAIDSLRGDPTFPADEDSIVGTDPELMGFSPGPGEAPHPPPLGIDGRLLELLDGSGGRGIASRDSVLRGMAERFFDLTRQGPLVVILDDLHRADEPSLFAVEFFAKELKDRPLWILGACRPYLSLPKSGRARLEQLERATYAQRIDLPPLTLAEISDYLRTNDPSREYTPEEVALGYSETGGNPLLLQQFSRRTSVGNEARDPPVGADTPLDDQEQYTLDLAAVIGAEFDFDTLLHAGAVDEARLTEIVHRLVGRGLLVEHAGETFAFPGDRLRGEIYGRLPADRRRLFHRQAGEALEAVGTPNMTRTFALAHQFYLGREWRKALHYNRIAANFADRALAPDAAWDHFSRALESQRNLGPDDRDAQGELVLELARVKEELGLLKDAERILREFLGREKENPRLSPSHRATLEIFLARVLIDKGDTPAAEDLAKKVVDSPGIQDQRLVRIAAHRQLGQVLYYSGHFAEALAQHTEEIRLAREVGNELILARAQVWRIAALQMMGQTQQAITEARETTAARDRFGSARESAQAHLFLGDILADARSPPEQRHEAIAEYGAAIRFAETANDPRRIAWALYKTAELLREAARRTREPNQRKAVLKEGLDKLVWCTSQTYV
ncbi:MAG: ATP-binding protein [Thermoplasmata archaeon]